MGGHPSPLLPRLVVTRDGWSLSSPEGRITAGGRWPRAGPPITCAAAARLHLAAAPRLWPSAQPSPHHPAQCKNTRAPRSLQASPHLAFDFVDRQHIAARLALPGVVRSLACGESSRRGGEGSHLEKARARAAGAAGRAGGSPRGVGGRSRQACSPPVRAEWGWGWSSQPHTHLPAAHAPQVVRTLPGGKLELDTAAIRRRLDTSGSAYVAPGPHRLVTPQPGLGARRAPRLCQRALAPVRQAHAQLCFASSCVGDTQPRTQPAMRRQATLSPCWPGWPQTPR